MRGILIDPYARTITEVDTDGMLESMYDLLSCKLVEVLGIPEVELSAGADAHDLWVDEEGLLAINEDTMFFTFNGMTHPIAGEGLVLGVDLINGDSKGATVALDEISKMVQFLTLGQVQDLL